MRKLITLLFLLFLPMLVWAQSVVVPKNIYFAGIQLKISDEAQQEIQKKVDALHRNPSYFRMKVELADAYFPLIERTFKELGVPEDLKFLALQESGLIGDAVSTSNAVGYWQMKREAASDFNLRVNNLVDERKHITEASRGAARYFLRSNNYYNNWFNTTLSYYLGYSGAKPYTSPSDNGSRKMDVTHKTNHYLLTFLAHKIAYENFVGKANMVSIKELRATPGQSLVQIALEHKADPSELEKYNKWLLGSTIPSDKDYFVLVPVRLSDRSQVILASKDETSIPGRNTPSQNRAASITKQNGLNAFIARTGDTKDILALQAGISTRRFLMYNDMYNFDKIVDGGIYYTEPKHSSAATEYHIVQPGETSHQISQKHGIKLGQLLFKNRMSRSEALVPGRVLWLQKRRPSRTPVEIRDLNRQNTVATAAGTRATPNVTERTSAAKATTAQQKEPTPPKDNIFKRFIRSFDRFKKKPVADAEPVEETEPVITTTQPEQQETIETVPVEVATEPSKAPETPAKPKETILYPGKKPVVVTESKPQEATKAETDTLGIDTPETMVVDTIKTEVEEIAVETTVTTPEPVQQPVAKPTHHIVKQGETLYSISRMYATTVSDIVSWNNLGDAPIKIGQDLLIAEPLRTPEKDPFQKEEIAPSQGTIDYHTVATGETLYQIAKKYKVNINDLRNWNNLADNNIAIGQRLLVTAPAGVSSGDEAAIPQSETKAASTTNGEALYHTVAAGESMYQISRKYGVTIKDIMQWNNKGDFNVSLGEKLLIRKN